MIGTPNHSVQYGHQFKRRKLSDGHDTPSSAPPIEPLKWDPASFQGTLFQNDQGQVFRPPFSAVRFARFFHVDHACCWIRQARRVSSFRLHDS